MTWKKKTAIKDLGRPLGQGVSAEGLRLLQHLLSGGSSSTLPIAFLSNCILTAKSRIDPVIGPTLLLSINSKCLISLRSLDFWNMFGIEFWELFEEPGS